MTIPPPFKHQTYSTKFDLEHPRVFDMSDAGTGKTRAHIDACWHRRQNGGGKILVIGPKSILQPVWGDDIEKFCPQARYIIANAKNRLKAFNTEADFYITNHDATKFLAEHLELLTNFDTVISDESTAFKHSNSQRSKALRKITKTGFPYRINLTATPDPNTVLDMWHQALILDDGARLGNSYYRYRDAVATPTQVGPSRDMIEWKDKDGAEEAVAGLLSDITIRHIFEECIDIPPNRIERINFRLSPSHRNLYEKLRATSILELENSDVTAIHSAALKQKLLQVCSGAVYHDNSYTTLNSDRYELVTELALQHPHSIVAFLWRHQREELLKEAQIRKISVAFIDGTVPDTKRPQIIQDFQNGRYRILLLHPQTAAHGLTLTRGTAATWASPTHNAEHFIQFNKRIYRAGQTQPTTTILITAEDTLEEEVYAENLDPKLKRMSNLLDILRLNTRQAA